MPFPESPRVVYKEHPLSQVIGQLRFPRILCIDSEAPVAYQEKIRKQYPLFQEKLIEEIPAEMTGFLSPKLINALSSSDKKAYDFMSNDKLWAVGLTSEFIALTSYHYD